MRTAAVLVIAMLPAVAAAQDTSEKKDPSRARVEATGCVKGSILTQTDSALRWRIRGPKALMKQIKEHSGRELAIVGSTKNAQTGMVIGNTRIGKTNIYIGNSSGSMGRDPLPEPPTIDVESFKATGESCR